MATYSAITSGQIDAESYIDTTLVGQWTNNVLAMFEGDASASSARLQFPALDSTAGQAITPWELIDSITASNDASIDFESLNTATYKSYKIVVRNCRPATNVTSLWLRVGTGGTPTYQTSAYDYASSFHDDGGGADVNVGTNDGVNGISTAIVVLEFEMSNSSTKGTCAVIYGNDLDSTSINKQFFHHGISESSTGNAGAWSGAGQWDNNTTAVTALRLMAHTGNITSGTFLLYGMRQ